MVHNLSGGDDLAVVALFADQAPPAAEALGRVDDLVLGVELPKQIINPLLKFRFWGSRFWA